MIRPILIGGSIGLIVGVLLGTVGGSSHPFEVILQMIFCSFGGAMLGACCGFLTRKKGANKTFLPSHQPLSENSSNYNLLTWAATIIALIAAIIKGFMLGTGSVASIKFSTKLTSLRDSQSIRSAFPGIEIPG